MNENINKKFDVKNFDYDKCYEEVKENASKNINIIVCGATGVGKSSLINDFFEFDKDSAAPVGSSGKPPFVWARIAMRIVWLYFKII